MIELIYNEEEDTALEETSLPEPKNVKQVGEPGELKKIFIEDFVHTYLLKYSTEGNEKAGIAVLLGCSEKSGGKRHLYIKSAFPVEGVREKQGKYDFSENVWGTIYMECGKYFPDQEIVGWFLSRPGFLPEKTPAIEETHRTYFSGAEKVLFLMEPMEGESAFFGFDGNRFTKQSGYYIYYEKNDPMRDFIMEKKIHKQTSGNEKPDVTMANYRKILKEKKAQNEKRKKKAVSYGAKVAAALVLFVGAVAFRNQTDQFAKMQQQISTMSQEEVTMPASSEEVVVEELSGDVEEQEAIFEEPVSEEKSPEEIPITEEESPEEISVTEEMPEEEKPQESQETGVDAPDCEEYVVQVGDTLAKISRDFYGTNEKISEICNLNGIIDGDYIQAGEIILLP